MYQKLKQHRKIYLLVICAQAKVLSVYPETVDFGSRQGRRILSATGVVRLRRGSRKSENAVLGQKMLFLDAHKLVFLSVLHGE